MMSVCTVILNAQEPSLMMEQVFLLGLNPEMVQKKRLTIMINHTGGAVQLMMGSFMLECNGIVLMLKQ